MSLENRSGGGLGATFLVWFGEAFPGLRNSMKMVVEISTWCHAQEIKQNYQGGFEQGVWVLGGGYLLFFFCFHLKMCIQSGTIQWHPSVWGKWPLWIYLVGNLLTFPLRVALAVQVVCLSLISRDPLLRAISCYCQSLKMVFQTR